MKSKRSKFTKEEVPNILTAVKSSQKNSYNFYQWNEIRNNFNKTHNKSYTSDQIKNFFYSNSKSSDTGKNKLLSISSPPITAQSIPTVLQSTTEVQENFNSSSSSSSVSLQIHATSAKFKYFLNQMREVSLPIPNSNQEWGEIEIEALKYVVKNKRVYLGDNKSDSIDYEILHTKYMQYCQE